MAEDVLQEITLRVSKEAADAILKKGKVEVVLRRKDKKFWKFFKAKVDAGTSESKVAQEIMNAAEKLKQSGQGTSEGIRKLLNDADLAQKKLTNLDLGKVLSAQMKGLENLSSQVLGLSYVQMGLQVVNIAVDVAGFIIIAKKMDGLADEVEKLSTEVHGLTENEKEKMHSNSEKLYMKYNSFVTKINDGDPLDRDDLEEYLMDSKAFISRLCRLVESQSLDAETLLNMIFMLLPAYTSALCIFLRAYYSEKHGTPMNYEKFLEVYQQINSAEFRDAVQDYYLIDYGFSLKDVVDIETVQLATVFSERLEIDDQLELIDALGSDEAYQAFEKALDEAVEKEIEEQADEIAGYCGEYAEECRRVLKATA